MGLRINNDRDCWLMNAFWFYGSGLITKELFDEVVEILKHDITEDYCKKELNRITK